MTAFGPYEVLEQVAVGSTGTLYRARHTDIGREVALKVLHPQLLAVPGMLERLRSEARMLAGLDDPHVVAVYDFVEDDDGAWIAEEWVSGATLQAVLEAHGRLAPEQAIGAVHGALQGLAHAHGRGLVHRDIAPSNVLTDLAGTSMLVDFGLAAPVGTTGVCGTPAFVSPEAVRGEAVGTAGDVYSAGAVLHLLLSGAPPFPAADPTAVLQRHLTDPAPALEGHGPELTDLLQRCLAKDPQARPPDAPALLAELREAAERQYGPGWLSRAGIAGLVAATVDLGLGTGGGAVAAGTVVTEAAVDTGSATVATVVTTVLPVVAAAVAAVPAPPPPEHEHHRRHRHRRRRLKPGPLVAAVAVVVLGGGTAAVTLTGGGGGSPKVVAEPSSSASPTPSATPSPTPSPTPSLSTATAPHGTYRVDVRVLTSNQVLQPAGSVLTGVWTVVTQCDALPCTGTITSTLGAAYTTTWDGTTLVATGSRLSPCFNTQTRQQLPGGKDVYREDIVNTLKLVRSDQGVPTLLKGTAVFTSTRVRALSNCDGVTRHQTRQVTLTRTA